MRTLERERALVITVLVICTVGALLVVWLVSKAAKPVPVGAVNATNQAEGQGATADNPVSLPVGTGSPSEGRARSDHEISLAWRAKNEAAEDEARRARLRDQIEADQAEQAAQEAKERKARAVLHDLAVVKSTWSRGGFGAVAEWSVTVKNTGSVAYRDIVFRAEYAAPSGTVVDRTILPKTVYEIIKPGKTVTLHFSEFVHNQATRAKVEITDAVAMD